jgi:hypothetical protein
VDGEAGPGTGPVTAGCGRFEREERASLADLQGYVTAGWHRDGKDSLADVVEIDLGFGGSFGFPGVVRLLLAVGLFVGVGLLFAVGLFVSVRLFVVRGLLLVALGRKWRRERLVEDGEVDGTRGGTGRGMDIEGEASPVSVLAVK